MGFLNISDKFKIFEFLIPNPLTMSDDDVDPSELSSIEYELDEEQTHTSAHSSHFSEEDRIHENIDSHEKNEAKKTNQQTGKLPFISIDGNNPNGTNPNLDDNPNISGKDVPSFTTHKKKKKKPYGINPYHPLRRAWEYWMFLLSELVFWIIPYQWIFDYDLTFLWILPSLIIDLFFLADVFISTRTGFMNFGIIELKKEFIKNYIPKWRLIIYWISPWPYYLIGYFLNSKLIYRITMTISIIRIIRLYDAYITMKRNLIDNIPLTKMAMLFTMMFTVIHVFSCAFWLTGHLELPGPSWIDLVAGIKEESQIYQYFHTYYYITTTILTIGYGDIHPYTFPEICVIIVVEAIGVFFYNFLVSNMVSIVADPTRTGFLMKYQKIFSAFKWRGVSDESMNELLRFYEYIWDLDRDQNDFYETAAKMPESLQRRISLALHMEIFNRVDAFQDLPTKVLEEVGLALKPKVFTPGDFLLKAGKVSDKMYFITEGKVDVLNACGSFITSFDGSTGTVFGESSVINGTEEVTCVIAETYVEAYALSKKDLDSIQGIHENFARVRMNRHHHEIHQNRHEAFNVSITGVHNPVNPINLHHFRVHHMNQNNLSNIPRLDPTNNTNGNNVDQNMNDPTNLATASPRRVIPGSADRHTTIVRNPLRTDVPDHFEYPPV
ncbi:voltage and ligand gated potassium channel [Tritrichomonas foetus]|uniref:Voltage and ligand gated potassium channel n=1 Tax=Tritrichomonas foetus TaxID=1144522 RepID=A0A1J4KJJ4_9EUKA|nr:voltage and ligand gated potassium channel [Tritrichomonas foetus]|eukprot:OHT09533.1 voltage and ligand gated potassium channel [Tritrichomonas foetus]